MIAEQEEWNLRKGEEKNYPNTFKVSSDEFSLNPFAISKAPFQSMRLLLISKWLRYLLNFNNSPIARLPS